ncbi:MAG: diacylglycerol kinase family protein [Prolixibacteraceae bacterium]
MPETTGILWQVVLNPHAGGGKGAHDQKIIEQLLRQSDIHYQLSISQFPGHAIELTRNLVREGATHLIVAGGDGTLNEVVNGIFQAEQQSHHEITLGMLPVGTGNDWIKTFGIPDHYQKAIDIIKTNKTVKQDVGEITCHIDGQTSVRYFANIAGFGFDALVAKNANNLKFKGITGIRVYIQSLFSGYVNYKSRNTRIIIDGTSLEVNLFSASIGIGKFNGGGMMQVPEANPLQGLFHITVIRKIGIWGILTNFKGLYSGDFIRDFRVSTHVGQAIEIASDTPLPGESDGETLGAGSFKIEMIAHRLRVIYGSDKFLGNLDHQ